MLDDLVSERGGELPGGRPAIHIGQFSHGAARLDLGALASPNLIHQPANQCGLQQKRSKHGNDPWTILLPCVGFPEADFASRRQIVFGNLPLLEHAPVEDRFDELASHNWDCRCTFTVEEAQQDTRSRLADWRRLNEESSRTAVSKSGLLINHDWTIGNFSDECESIIGTVACATAAEGRVENCSILR